MNLILPFRPQVAPSLNLSPDFSSSVKDAKPYPLWIKPDNELSVRDVMALHRDHYEGTPFDMTKDLTAGPFGALDRSWKLADFLITKYNDGYVQDEKGDPREVGYPAPWLKEELKKNPEKFNLKDKRPGDKEL